MELDIIYEYRQVSELDEELYNLSKTIINKLKIKFNGNPGYIRYISYYHLMSQIIITSYNSKEYIKRFIKLIESSFEQYNFNIIHDEYYSNDNYNIIGIVSNSEELPNVIMIRKLIKEIDKLDDDLISLIQI